MNAILRPNCTFFNGDSLNFPGNVLWSRSDSEDRFNAIFKKFSPAIKPNMDMEKGIARIPLM